MKKVRKLLAMTVMLSVLAAAAVRGQSADGFDPNANGTVQVIVVQPDGKILLGGDFTTLLPNGGAAVTRNHIARLNPTARSTPPSIRTRKVLSLQSRCRRMARF